MRRNLTAGFAAASVLLCVSGTAVYAMPETAVTNIFQTGTVDIRLEEYMLTEDGTEKEWEDIPDILPGAEISKIPRITGEGADCYVRVKLTFEDTGAVTEDDLYGMEECWIRAQDGYYYLRDILKNGESVDVFKGIFIPEDLPQDELEGKSFRLRIDADAIQAANFTPDFESEAPWGQTEIKESRNENGHDITVFQTQERTSLQVEYQGDAEALTADPDNFFKNLPYLMPGDSYSDNAALINSSGKEIRIYFRNVIVEEDDILEKILLTIAAETGGEELMIYSGPLKGEAITDNICLGTIPAGENGNFRFTLDVPAELDNDYSLLSSCVRWIFSTEEIPEPMQTVKTGDDGLSGAALAGLVMMLGGAVMGVAALLQYLSREGIGTEAAGRRAKNRPYGGKETG